MVGHSSTGRAHYDPIWRFLPENQALYSSTPCSIYLKLQHKWLKTLLADGVAHLSHQIQIVVQIVDRIQTCSKDFAGAMQMMQIGA